MKKTILLLVLLVSMYLFIDFVFKEIDKNLEPDIEIGKIKDPVDLSDEKELIPKYKLYIPEIKDTCDKEACVTQKFLDELKTYLTDNNYGIDEKSNSFYIIKDDILVEVSIGIKEDESYTYTLSKTTTIENVQRVIDGKDPIVPHKEIASSKETDKATKIAVLNYHFFYDGKNEKCNEIICLDIKNFEKQLKYLKDNNFKTLTMDEFINWMYKKIDLPKKSVLITVDDGAMGTGKLNGNKLIPLLEKYQMHATLFLITGWWDKKDYQSNYLEIESHGHNIHVSQNCNGSSKAKLLCLNKNELTEDLSKSIKALDSNKAFCYPFYAYNDTSSSVLKNLGFKVAFIGGNKKATQSNNKYRIPRYIIYKSTSLNSFKTMVN